MGRNRAAKILAVTMVAVGCAQSAPRPQPAPQATSTITVALDTEPDVLNVARSSLAATAFIGGTMLASPYRVTADLRYEPWLLDGEADLTEDPFTVTYRIRDDAVWSDGTPVTAEDFAFTWRTLTDPRWHVPIRTPADRIEHAETIDDKTIRFTYSEPYAGWRNLFLREGVLPAHVLEEADFNTAWNDEISVSSGPFQLKDWDRGIGLTIERNPTYWDEAALVDEVTFRFITDTQTLPQALRGGEIDVAPVSPEQLRDLEGSERLRTSIVPGVRWEFIDLRTDAIPAFVRQAIAFAVDREKIVDTLVRPAWADASVLDSVLHLPHQDAYEPHFARYTHNSEQAIYLLEDHGCQRAEDGVFSCDGERLHFTYTTVAGRERAELQFEIIQADLQAIGVRITADFGDIPTVVQHMQQGAAQLAGLNINLGWEPHLRDALFGCDAPLGLTSYCNQEVTQLLQRGARTLDAQERRRVYNRADELIAEDIPSLPLYQVPDVLVWHERLAGVEHSLDGNPVASLPSWHVVK